MAGDISQLWNKKEMQSGQANLKDMAASIFGIISSVLAGPQQNTTTAQSGLESLIRGLESVGEEVRLLKKELLWVEENIEHPINDPNEALNKTLKNYYRLVLFEYRASRIAADLAFYKGLTQQVYKIAENLQKYSPMYPQVEKVSRYLVWMYKEILEKLQELDSLRRKIDYLKKVIAPQLDVHDKLLDNMPLDRLVSDLSTFSKVIDVVYRLKDVKDPKQFYDLIGQID